MGQNDEIAYIVAQSGPLNGQRWELTGSLLIGREPGCEIVIVDRQVSRHHARISLDKDGILIEDLGSKNGTHLNGQLIHEPSFLQDGDVIQVALAQQFVYLSSDATLPLEGELNPQGSMASTETASSGSPFMRRLRLDKRSRRVWIGQQEIEPPLSVSQFHLLEMLYDNEGRVVSRATLITDVWGDEEAVDVSEQALDALIRRLRDRVASLDPSHQYVVTVRGHGLRLDNPTA